MSTYTFNDVLIKPKYSEIRSRKDVDLSVNMGEVKIRIPVMSANMKTITGPRMASEMRNRGAIGVLHRFNTIEGAVADFNETNEGLDFPVCTSTGEMDRQSKKSCMVSIGVGGDYKERFDALYDAGARYFCIDIAHGHSIMMRDTIEYIKGQKSDIYVMAGNIATAEAARDLASWGANAVKVGIGPGSMCQTRTNTGVGVPQLWALEQVYNADLPYNTLIVADGGIKTVGDIAKALKYSHIVMLGSFFAGSMETPGNVFRRKDGSRYKVYGGSASASNKSTDGSRPEFVEGVTEEVPLGDHVKFLLREICEGLQSSCSYVGAKNLSEYRNKCEFIHISGGGKQESKL